MKTSPRNSKSNIIESFYSMIMIGVRNKQLITALTRRDILSRYKGSSAGIIWSLINPLLMLTVYTFVFSVVFKARWANGSGSKAEFALVLFSGLLVFNLFAECINRAPSLIIANSNYVKRIIFPLEILPIIGFLSSFFHMSMSFVVWLLFYSFFFGIPSWTIILFPLVILPFSIFIIGLSWILASLGVYFRDINQVIGVFTTVMMFMSPIFYSVKSLPVTYQNIMNLNPITIVVEQSRQVMIWGHILDFKSWIIYLICSVFFAFAGYSWFQKTRNGFADVV